MKTVHFVSLGCPKNRVDTEVMLGVSADQGYALVDAPEEADVLVVNTCGFIGEAKQESVDAILEAARQKEAGLAAGRPKKLVVTGCLSQRYQDDLAKEIPEVDHFLGSADALSLAPILNGEGKRLGVTTEPSWVYDQLSPRRNSMPGYMAYVKIAEGCDRPCSFCIIPKLRGPQRSRSIESVVEEARALVGNGVREINLVAQDLSAYGHDLSNGGPKDEDGPNLARLVRALDALPGLRWLRLHYLYPSSVTDELIAAMAECPRVVPYVDMPLQHIDEGLLKSMRRGYSAHVVHEVLDKLRQRIPGIVVRTTFIVGHPGETEASFASLCEFIEAQRFDRVGVFTYSHEEGTVSALLPRRVAKATAEKRRRELMRLQQGISRQAQESLVGRDLEVLVEGPSDESEYVLSGRWTGQARDIDGQVYLTFGAGSPEARPGDFVRARVTHFADYDLAAEVLAG